MNDPKPQTKQCDRCGDHVPLDGFHRRSRSRDGRQSKCKPCTSEARAESRKAGAKVGATSQAKRDLVRAAVLAAGEKKCAGCLAEMPLAEFSQKVDHFTGLNERCRSCRRQLRASAYERNRSQILAANQAWYEQNKVRYLEVVKAWRIANPDRRREYQGRRKARMLGTGNGPVDLAALWTGSCALCGAEIDSSLKGPDPLSASLDHRVPLSRGGAHSQENLQWAHLVCNVRKGNRPATSATESLQG